MLRPLPFDGYSWQISQHEIRFDEKPLSGLLLTAARFEGERDYAADLNHALAGASFVTPNLREGVPSPWRDYQQVLPEMGLIVSTRLVGQILLTEIGRAYLAGWLNHEQLMTLQLLRYQYPNGYKSSTLPSFQNNNIALRPGLMILRTLIGLWKAGNYGLTIDDIVNSLLPNKSDTDWEISVQEILTSSESRIVNPTVRRNVTAWVRLLAKTKTFEFDQGSLRLSAWAMSDIDRFERLADRLIDKPLWHPQDTGQVSLDWFSFFGSFRYVDTELLGLVESSDHDIGLIQQSLESDPEPLRRSIELTDFSRIDTRAATLSLQTDELIQAYLDGQAKLFFAKQEHDKLVNSLADYYRNLGWQVRHDPFSVDLLVSGPDNIVRIIEVKTTTQRSLTKQVRTAVGQVLEYKYRYELDHRSLAQCEIVVNRPLIEDDWRRGFCNANDINLEFFSQDRFQFRN